MDKEKIQLAIETIDAVRMHLEEIADSKMVMEYLTAETLTLYCARLESAVQIIDEETNEGKGNDLGPL
jgi:FtsZ-binding cell division protein ZapB